MSQSATIKFQNRKATDFIAVHCAATDAQDIGAKEIDVWHRQRGFLCIGYHFVIRRDGRLEDGLNSPCRPTTAIGAHVQGYNHNSIGICMVGGGSAKENNNFTAPQWATLETLLRDLKHEYPDAVIQGHRDFPDVTKWCPSFDTKKWVTERGIA